MVVVVVGGGGREEEREGEKERGRLSRGDVCHILANLVCWDSGSAESLHSKVVDKPHIPEGTHDIINHMIIT